MTTYDLHQHLWPEAFIAALRGRTTPPRLDGDVLETCEGRFPVELAQHDPDTRLSALDRDGIEVAVLSLQPSLGLGRPGLLGVRRIGARVGRRSSRARRRGASEPSRRRASARASPAYPSARLRSSTSTRRRRRSTQRPQPGATVFVHPEAGSTSGTTRPEWWEWVVGYPARMQEAYVAWLAFGRERWPTVRVLFAMLGGGGPFQLERLARRGVHVRSALDPNTFFDVSTHGRRAIELCIETFGVGQLVYGSDTPVVDSRPTLDAVRGFGDAVTYVLQSDTPARLLT